MIIFFHCYYSKRFVILLDMLYFWVLFSPHHREVAGSGASPRALLHSPLAQSVRAAGPLPWQSARAWSIRKMDRRFHRRRCKPRTFKTTKWYIHLHTRVQARLWGGTCKLRLNSLGVVVGGFRANFKYKDETTTYYGDCWSEILIISSSIVGRDNITTTFNPSHDSVRPRREKLLARNVNNNDSLFLFHTRRFILESVCLYGGGR